jgi:hypothetical protein
MLLIREGAAHCCYLTMHCSSCEGQPVRHAACLADDGLDVHMGTVWRDMWAVAAQKGHYLLLLKRANG